MEEGIYILITPGSQRVNVSFSFKIRILPVCKGSQSGRLNCTKPLFETEAKAIHFINFFL